MIETRDEQHTVAFLMRQFATPCMECSAYQPEPKELQ